jgi:hypothetical protein
MPRKKKIPLKSFSSPEDQARSSAEREAVEGDTLEPTVARQAAPDQKVMQSSGVESEGAKMEQGKGILDSFSEVTRTLFSLDAARRMAALYIETGEKLAEGALDFQAKASEWAKDTPLAAAFEAQNSMSRKLVELSANTARQLWRIEESAERN